MKGIIPRGIAGLCLLCTTLTFRTANATECCPEDLNNDTFVDAADLALLLGGWGSCPPRAECPADIDDDSEVGAADLALLLGHWGPSCTFDYGPAPANTEAAQIGLEMQGPSGALLVPEAAYLRIDRDLELIRMFEPALAAESHSPAWIPNQMLIGLLSGAPQQAYLCLNEYYQVIDIQLISQSLNLYLLTFAGDLNVPALAIIYEEVPSTNYAEPNGLIGGQNYWVPTPLGDGVWRWEIDDGFLDCFDGCDCHRLYEFETDLAGHVTLISYQEVGQTWCDFGGR